MQRCQHLILEDRQLPIQKILLPFPFEYLLESLQIFAIYLRQHSSVSVIVVSLVQFCCKLRCLMSCVHQCVINFPLCSMRIFGSRYPRSFIPNKVLSIRPSDFASRSTCAKTDSGTSQPHFVTCSGRAPAISELTIILGIALPCGS